MQYQKSATVAIYHFDNHGIKSGMVQLVKRNDDQLALGGGEVSVIVQLCTDFWDGSALRGITMAERKRIIDLYANAVAHDKNVVGYCYSPFEGDVGIL